MSFERGKFRPEDLEKVYYSNPVVAKCGGPVMNVVCEEGDNVLCEYEEDGKLSRILMPKVCVYSCVPYFPRNPTE